MMWCRIFGTDLDDVLHYLGMEREVEFDKTPFSNCQLISRNYTGMNDCNPAIVPISRQTLNSVNLTSSNGLEYLYHFVVYVLS